MRTLQAIISFCNYVRQDIGQLELEIRKDLHLFLCRWSRPVVSSEELKDNYGHLLEQIKASQANLILVDTRRRGYISPEDEAWIMNIFFPTVENLSPTTYFYAYLVTPSSYQHIKNDVGFGKLENFSAGTKIKVFDAERDAVSWLRSKI